MKNTYKILTIIIVLFVVITIFATSRDQEQIKIGAILPLSGALASVGEDMRNGMTLAMDETGLDVVMQDGQADPKKSLNAARGLVDINNVSVLLTAFRGASLSVASGMNDEDILIFATTATTEGKSVSSTTPKLFVIGAEIVKSAEVLGDYAEQNNLCQSVGLIAEQSETGKDKIRGFSTSVGESKTVLTELFDPSSTDFRTIIAKLKAQKADCIFVEIRSNTLPVLLRQMDENKYYPKIFSTSYSVTPAVFAASPKSELDNLVFSSTLLDEDNALTQSFLLKYKNRFGKDATDFSAVGYEMIKMIDLSMKQCGNDVKCIGNNLNKVNNLGTSLGRLTIEENQEIQLKEYKLFKAQDGKFVPIN